MEKLDRDRDPRIIPGGRVLRKACLDELPQLFNVLRGEMSLVGPRPCIPYEAEEYLRWHTHRFDILPGMTGLWQVSGKNKLSFEQMIRLDIAYTNRMSPMQDLKILLLTLPTVIGLVLEAGVKKLRGKAFASQRNTFAGVARKGRSAMHKIAVVGCGYWGPNLVRNFRSLPGVKVAVICDKSRERLDHVGQLYPEVEKTTDFSRIIKDSSIDMVAIATNVCTHHSLAHASLQSGKHTFVEKPLAASVVECQKLVSLAERRP